MNVRRALACAADQTLCSGSPPAAVASITGSNIPAPQTYKGATMNYTCLTGYTGSAYYTCQTNGQYSNSQNGGCTRSLLFKYRT